MKWGQQNDILTDCKQIFRRLIILPIYREKLNETDKFQWLKKGLGRGSIRSDAIAVYNAL